MRPLCLHKETVDHLFTQCPLYTLGRCSHKQLLTPIGLAAYSGTDVVEEHSIKADQSLEKITPSSSLRHRRMSKPGIATDDHGRLFNHNRIPEKVWKTVFDFMVTWEEIDRKTLLRNSGGKQGFVYKWRTG